MSYYNIYIYYIKGYFCVALTLQWWLRLKQFHSFSPKLCITSFAFFSLNRHWNRVLNYLLKNGKGCVFMHKYIHTHVHTYLPTYVHTQIPACIYLCVCVCIMLASIYALSANVLSQCLFNHLYLQPACPGMCFYSPLCILYIPKMCSQVVLHLTKIKQDFKAVICCTNLYRQGHDIAFHRSRGSPLECVMKLSVNKYLGTKLMWQQAVLSVLIVSLQKWKRMQLQLINVYCADVFLSQDIEAISGRNRTNSYSSGWFDFSIWAELSLLLLSADLLQVLSSLSSSAVSSSPLVSTLLSFTMLQSQSGTKFDIGIDR